MAGLRGGRRGVSYILPTIWYKYPLKGGEHGRSLGLTGSLVALPGESHLLDEKMLLPLPGILLLSAQFLLAIHCSVKMSSP